MPKTGSPDKMLFADMLVFALVAVISCVNGQPDSDTLNVELDVQAEIVDPVRGDLVSPNSELEKEKLGKV